MRGSDIFDLYRQLLAIILATYMVVRLANFIWRWQLASGSARRWESMARRYLVVQFLRIRVRRFVVDLLQLSVLAVVFAYLVWLHWQRL
ncbi:MAG: hypothetical protein ACYSUQ_04805 [Planctomycetota bacterium]|jgi:hypothetical protein